MEAPAASDALCRVLDAYSPVDARELADIARLRSNLGDDIWSRRSPLHVTGSALVVHVPTRVVLMRWHPRDQRWMQVGGHFDPGETDPLAVALREAREETGLTDLVAAGSCPGVPVQIAILPVGAHGDEPAHEHADIRYVLATNSPAEIVAESDAAHLQWLAFAEAIELVTEDNLRAFLRRVERLVEAS